MDSNFSKHYVNYTKTLTSPADDLLVFGIHGKIFHLLELPDDSEDDLDFIVNFSVALFLGLVVMLISLRFLKRWNKMRRLYTPYMKE